MALRRLQLFYVAWFFSLAAAGCPAATSGGGAATSTSSRPVGHAALEVESPESLYEVRRPADLKGLEARLYDLIAAIASKLGRPVPSTDDAACRAARQIAVGLLPEGPPPSPLVEFAMRSLGLVDPPPHLVVASAPPKGERELLDQLTSKLEGILRQGSFLRVGLGLGMPLKMPGERRLVIALLDGRVRFRPLPRVLRRGERARLEFELLSAHQSLHLVVADPKGAIANNRPGASGKSYVSSLTCRDRGVYQVEVTGDGQYGTEVLANFPVYCAQPAPRDLQYESAAFKPGAEEQIERELFELTNRMRRAAGLPLFRYNRAVAAVARQHSKDMRDEGFVGHVSPKYGSPADRLRRAGIAHLAARENVARAYSAAEALSELQKSPAHRANLVASDVDEIGVGVVVERSSAAPVLLVTQNFIRSGTPFNPALGPGPAYKIVDARRRRGGLSPLRREPELEKLAARYLERALGSADDQRRADADLSAALNRFGARFQKVEGVLVKITVLEGLAQASDLGKRGPTHIGIAVGGHSGQTAVFMLLATPR